MANTLLFWLSIGSALCWPVCFWFMWLIFYRQDTLLKELREQGKRIESLSKEEHDLMKELHPAVKEIKEEITES